MKKILIEKTLYESVEEIKALSNGSKVFINGQEWLKSDNTLWRVEMDGVPVTKNIEGIDFVNQVVYSTTIIS
jgi:hypothetical protein